MRVPVLVLLLALPAFAGCASTPAQPASGSGVVVTSPSGNATAAAPAQAFAFNQTFSSSSASVTKDFVVTRAGWLCVDAKVVRESGDATVTVYDAGGNATMIVSTAQGVLQNATVLANDEPSTWHVKIDTASFSGNLNASITQMS